jgi:hypothetical protein
MDYELTPIRLLILGALLAGYFLLGGLPPRELPDGRPVPSRTMKAWLYCTALFVVGAGMATVVEHRVGDLDPVSLRPMYILIGVLAMAGAGFWWYSARATILGAGP